MRITLAALKRAATLTITVATALVTVLKVLTGQSSSAQDAQSCDETTDDSATK